VASLTPQPLLRSEKNPDTHWIQGCLQSGVGSGRLVEKETSWGSVSSRMWRCVAEQVFPEVPPVCQETLARPHSVTSQKTWMLNNTVVETKSCRTSPAPGGYLTAIPLQKLIASQLVRNFSPSLSLKILYRIRADALNWISPTPLRQFPSLEGICSMKLYVF
jgi:hypothetical protein